MAAWMQKCALVMVAMAWTASGCQSTHDRFNARTVLLRNTIYYVALQSDHPPGRDALFVDRAGTVLVRGSKAFKKAALIEGTAKLTDGRVLNVDRKVGRSWRWKFVKATYGLGAICPLVPFRSVAVDRSVVNLWSVLFIPRTKGMLLPSGKRHDGIWHAVDTGGAIRGDRIDLFGGAGRRVTRVFASHGIRHLQALRVDITGRLKRCPRE